MEAGASGRGESRSILCQLVTDLACSKFDGESGRRLVGKFEGLHGAVGGEMGIKGKLINDSGMGA